MKNTTNKIIKDYTKKKDVCHYEIADALGVSEFTFCRMLRKEFSKEETKRIKAVIDSIAESRK